MREYVKDWSVYPNFSEDEFRCSHTGRKPLMALEIIEFIQNMRTDLKFPMTISSGDRAPTHPIEARKHKPGEHSKGLCVDILCYGEKYFKILEYALKHKIKRIGIHQKGALKGRFIHIGVGKEEDGLISPAGWTY